jgi:hypothetical protein
VRKKKSTTRQSGQAQKPSSRLKNFGKLVGTWKISGPEIEEEVAFEWFDGGFFLMQRGWLSIWGRKIVFIEYIGYDEERQACVSHLFDNYGDFFTYVWEINVDQITIWFGRKIPTIFSKASLPSTGRAIPVLGNGRAEGIRQLWLGLLRKAPYGQSVNLLCRDQ